MKRSDVEVGMLVRLLADFSGSNRLKSQGKVKEVFRFPGGYTVLILWPDGAESWHAVGDIERVVGS